MVKMMIRSPKSMVWFRREMKGVKESLACTFDCEIQRFGYKKQRVRGLLLALNWQLNWV